MPNDPLIGAHARLMDCHRKIRQEFASLDEPSLKCFLGGHDSEQLREQVRKYGDGYTLRSVPTDLEDISSTEELVLIVGRFPWLGERSRFDPHEALIEIPYWTPRLRHQITMPDGSERPCRSLIWQDRCPVHGNRRNRSRVNQECLSERLPALDGLIRCQIEESKRLLLAWADWLREGKPRRQLILVTDCSDPISSSQIPEIARRTELHVETSLWGDKAQEGKLMDGIEEFLLGASNR